MDDRKLLELAARAIGHKIDPIDAMHDPERWACWNPLTDDGDALQLAVKLKITPHIDGNLTDAESTAGFATEAHFNDPYAATRRAIVRAAAAIAQEMPDE